MILYCNCHNQFIYFIYLAWCIIFPVNRHREYGRRDGQVWQGRHLPENERFEAKTAPFDAKNACYVPDVKELYLRGMAGSVT